LESIVELKDFKQTGYVLMYDNPSEDISELKREAFYEERLEKGQTIVHLRKGVSEETLNAAHKAYKRIVAARVASAVAFKALGYSVNQSVVLVSSKRTKLEITEAIEKANARYEKLDTELTQIGIVSKHNIGRRPYVKAMPIVQSQFVIYHDMAQKDLEKKGQTKLDLIGSRMSDLMTLSNPEEKAKALNALRQEERDLEDLDKIVSELGLKKPPSLLTLSDMIQKAIVKLKQ